MWLQSAPSRRPYAAKIRASPCKLYDVTDCDVYYPSTTTALMHGFAGWFDLDFCGSTETVHFSTAPECPGTHWYQCRLLFREPLAVNRGQTVTGTGLWCRASFACVNGADVSVS
jgi:hypothetical protein